jgi:membrane-bound lytic murein transglycosylase D
MSGFRPTAVRFLAGVVCLAAAGARADDESGVHEATLRLSEDSDPYPVVLTVDSSARATIRADRRRAGEQPDVPSAHELERGEMEREACRAFFGDGGCPDGAFPPDGRFDGARVPRVFTSTPPPAAGGAGDATAPAAGGTADLDWLQSLVPPDLPVRWGERVVWYLERFREPGRHRNALASWLRRSGRYAAMVREVFRRHGIPEDLLWVAAIESSFDPTEKSSAGAVGLWQFMPHGGRIYGLEQDRWADQRRNPERATEAVALYFRDLFDRFGSWDLAMAGFNMGYAGLERAILKFGTNDYWTLADAENAIPYGTSFYVAKAIAIAVASRNLERFGLGDLAFDAPVPYDLVEVRGVNTIAVMARAAGTTVAEFRALNPELLRDRTPPGAARWLVRIPRGGEDRFVRNLASARAEDQTRTYTVRFGETVDQVAERFRTTATRIRTLNGLDRSDALRGGDCIEVPDTDPVDLVVSERPPAIVPPDAFAYPGRRRIFYRVLAGDTVEAVAAAFGVSAPDLVAWNQIDPDARLTPGLVLQVFAVPSFDPSTAVFLDESQVNVLVGGSDALYEHLASLEGRVRIRYRIREGDTIDAIAARFQSSARTLGRINRFGSDPDLVPGEDLVVYAPPDEAERYRREADQERVDAGEIEAAPRVPRGGDGDPVGEGEGDSGPEPEEPPGPDARSVPVPGERIAGASERADGAEAGSDVAAVVSSGPE